MHLDTDEVLIRGIRNAYRSYGIRSLPANNKTVTTVSDDGEFVQYLACLQWWQSITVFDTFTQCHKNYHIGDFVTMSELVGSTDKE